MEFNKLETMVQHDQGVLREEAAQLRRDQQVVHDERQELAAEKEKLKELAVKLEEYDDENYD